MDIEEQYGKIYRYCYFKLHRQSIAEDITQETFLRFLESETYRENGHALRYLYTIARNLCIDECRKRPHESLPEDLADYDAEEKLIASLTLKMALAELDDEERELLLLKYVNEVPVSVICNMFGQSRFAIYRKTTGALKSLQKKLGKENFR